MASIEAPTLPGVDEHLDTTALVDYQQYLDRASAIEKEMAATAFRELDSTHHELIASHAQAVSGIRTHRRWLARRGLIDNEEVA